MLLVGAPDPSLEDARRYLEQNQDPKHAGVRFRILHYRAQLLDRIGPRSEAIEAAANARQEIASFSARLPPDFADAFLGGPWAAQILGIQRIQ
jgi:hypothetical protein